MATITAFDARNPAQRNIVQPSMLWITSGWFDYSAAGKGVILFSYPKLVEGGRVLIHMATLEITKAFAGGTPSIDIGTGTIANNLISNGGDITIVDADSIEPSADITEVTAGCYPALTGAVVTAGAAGLQYAIIPADTDVPVVYATLSAGLTAGKARLHLLASSVPVTA